MEYQRPYLPPPGCELTKLEEVVLIQAVRKCKQQGHNIVDEGYANREHGAIDLVCRRCGWSHHVTLY